MSSGNASDGMGSLNDFENLKNVVSPKVEDQNVPAEYLISDNLLVPGVLTQYLDEEVLFKPYLLDEIFNVPYNQIRHPPGPGIPNGCKYEVGNKVEVYLLDAKLNLHGWARSTIKSFAKDTYVVILEQRKSLVIVQRDKIRAITTGASLNNRYLYTFNIPVPQELQSFASDIKVHDSLCKAIQSPHIAYDFKNKALMISSNNADCESFAKMLLATYFTNLIQRMLLTKSINELGGNLKALKNGLLEEFQVHPDLLRYVIGKSGKNIRKAETIPGIIYITVLKNTNIVKIYARNQDALKKASEYLKLDKEIIEISNEIISKIIGNNGQIVQEIVNQSKLRHIVIISDENPASEQVTELEFIGTSPNIAQAKCLLKFQLDQLGKFNKLFLAGGDVNPQPNTAFGCKKIKLSSESPAEMDPSYKLARRVFSGSNYQENKKYFTKANPELIFYNANQSRSGQGTSSGRRFNPARRCQSRFVYETMEALVDDSEAKNSTDQIVAMKQFRQSTTNRSRERGRGLAHALIHDDNSSSSRESQNGSSPDENNEQVQKEPSIESGDASTSQDEREFERQRKQGAIKRELRNIQQRDNTEATSSTSDQTAEIQTEPAKQWIWRRKVWRNTTASSSDMQTWEDENLSKVYYGKSSTNNLTDTTGDSGDPEGDYEEI